MILNLQIFLTTFIGMSILALSMRRHAQHLPSKISQRLNHRRLVSLAGWTALSMALYLCIAHHGISTGWVLWFGHLTAAALSVAFLLSYQAKLIMRLVIMAILALSMTYII